MFAPLIALGLFGGVVWVISHAIFLLMHNESSRGVSHQPHDPITRFVEENYGSHFGHVNSLGAVNLQNL